MRTETLTDLIDILEDAAPVHSSYGSALSELEAELERRQTPITADALAKESTWRETGGSLYGKTWTWASYDGYGMLDLKIKTSEDGRLLGVYGCHDRILNATAMADLDDLALLMIVK